MNRYPLWKYLIIAAALLIGLIYTLPNFFGEAPAVQLSSGKATLKLDSSAVAPVQAPRQQAPHHAEIEEFAGNGGRARVEGLCASMVSVGARAPTGFENELL